MGAYLSREQIQEVERLMEKLGKEVKGKVEFVDGYPHGWKYLNEPPGEGRSWMPGDVSQ